MEAIERSSWEVCETAVQSETMSLVLGMVFSGDNILWISPQTPAGNTISLDVLATAYALWRDAQKVALKRGLDSADAAEALTNVVYRLTDKVSDGTAPEINNIRKYLFVGCTHALSRVAENAGILCPGDQDETENQLETDNGDFIDDLENAILCHDLLRAMPVKVRKAVVLRHMKGYSCKETAAAVGMSNNAARKAIHASLKKAYETCMGELKNMGLSKNSKTSKKAVKNGR